MRPNSCKPTVSAVNMDGQQLVGFSWAANEYWIAYKDSTNIEFHIEIKAQKPALAPRSFFGVEDFVDDDNSRPYTYQKG
uniref:Uncharacterized protein n=1 Tax=Solanum lycopersicum TaxID=4081 RepID=A0A3Q7G531_SOLLC